MTTAVALRLGAFAGALALAFAGALALGSAVDPIAAADPARTSSDHGAPGDQETSGDHEAPADGTPSDHGSPGAGTADQAGAAALPGLAVSEAGYTLVPSTTVFAPGKQQSLRFTVRGPDGEPVTAYDRSHEKDLHLIVVRRDLSGFDHLHPARDAAGTWSIPFTFATGGTWRVFADFTPTALGRTITLGTDVDVAGPYLPAPATKQASATSVDGYDVTLTGRPVAGKESELTFGVSRNGRPVADLQPYLGAYGHLVALRHGDLAYLHTHPGDEAVAGGKGGPQVRFGTTFPTAATYRLFLDFQHADVVHTAEFTVTVDASGNQTVAPSTTNQPTAPQSTTKPGDESTPHGHR